MKRSIRIILITSLMITLLTGINVWAKTSNGDPEKDALVFGCIDLTDINSYLKDVSFLRYEGPKIGIGKYMGIYGLYENGLFIADRVVPGQYWFATFSTQAYGFHLRQDPAISTITNNAAEADKITVNQGDIYFYGSYKYRVAKKAGFLSRGSFSLEKADTPSEKELLQMVLDKLKGSKWEPKIQERLAKL